MSESDRTNGIEAVLKTLTAQEEQVIRLRFAIGVDRWHTSKELAQRFSLTGEQIREIESTALRKLRRPSCLLSKQERFRANAFTPDQRSQV
jgi:DNA-directed RNA polymerase sigma subunit (sigma70/sigma32)